MEILRQLDLVAKLLVLKPFPSFISDGASDSSININVHNYCTGMHAQQSS